MAVSDYRPWTRNFETYLIEYYQRNPCLWNPKNKDYHNRAMRDDMLKPLAFQLSAMGKPVSVSMIKDKIKSLRTIYARELKRILEKKGEIQPTSKWFHFEKLSFLKDALVQRSKPNYLEIITIEDDISEDNEFENIPQMVKTEAEAEQGEMLSVEPANISGIFENGTDSSSNRTCNFIGYIEDSHDSESQLFTSTDEAVSRANPDRHHCQESPSENINESNPPKRQKLQFDRQILPEASESPPLAKYDQMPQFYPNQTLCSEDYDVEAFCNHMSVSLRRMSPRYRELAKLNIQQILCHYRIKELDSSPSTEIPPLPQPRNSI